MIFDRTSGTSTTFDHATTRLTAAEIEQAI